MNKPITKIIATVPRYLYSLIISHSMIGAAMLLGLAIILFSFSDRVGYLPIYTKTIHVKHYDSQSSDIKISTPVQFIENPIFKNKTIDISGDFSINPTAPSNVYFDLFQTSQHDKGLRYEIQRNVDNTYQSAILLKNKKSADWLSTFSIGNPPYNLSSGNTYHFYIKINKQQLLNYNLFKKNPHDYEEIINNGDIRGNFNDFVIDNIVVGSGFDQTRKFPGQIDNFVMKYTYFIPTFLDKANIIIIPLLLLFGLVISGLGNNKKIKAINFSEERKYFIIAPLIFIYPTLQLYADNTNTVTSFVVIKMIAAIFILSVFLFALLTYAYKDLKKALIASVLCSVFIFFTGKAYNSFSYLIRPDLFVFSAALILLSLHLILLRINNINKIIIVFTANMIGLLFAMSAISLIYNSIKISHATSASFNTASQDHHATTTLDKPDIYFIISDMHASQVSLKKHFGYANDPFISQLKASGFFVANNANSNYKYTFLSIPSMLNLSLIPKKINDPSKINDYYDKNQMALYLKKMGYKYIFISPRRYIIDKSHIADINLTCSKMSDFEGVLWSYSIFFRMNKFGDTYRNDTLCGINAIKEAALTEGPKFVFAHILSPHPPYVFDANGNQVPLDNQVDFKVNMSRVELNKQGYLNQLKFISKQLSETVRFILAHSKSTPIIILQGDHGFSLYEMPEFASGKEIPPDDNVNARMRPLAAYLFPRGGNSVLYDIISPINMTRGLLRFYFHRNDLTKIEDQAFWSPEADFFHFTDVTKTIRKQDDPTTLATTTTS